LAIIFAVFKYFPVKTVAIDTPGGKRNLKMKIKAQQMTFRCYIFVMSCLKVICWALIFIFKFPF
jgi:hypothetical protein